jgi:hypothetical protein
MSHINRSPLARATSVATVVAAALVAALPLAAPAHAGVAAKAKPKAAKVVITRVGKAPASAKPGSAFVLAVGLRNNGKKPSSTPVVVRLSRDASGTSSDPVIGSTSVRLGKKKSAAVSVRAVVPARTGSATYRLFACTPRRCTPAGAVRVLGASGQPSTPGRLSGSLHGDLYLVDQGDEAESGHVEHWKHDAHVSIQMKVSGPSSASATFASTGSQYGYTGAARTTDTFPPCKQVVDETRSGGGRLAWNNDPNHDEVWGNFGRLDMSKVSLGFYMRYDRAISDVSSGREDCTWNKPSASKAGNLTSLKLVQVGRTATTVTYKVDSFTGEMNTPSDWDQVTGNLVLDLD